MEKNNLFYKFQSGFRENHSCYTAINALTNTWLESIETQKLTGAVFLDFKKAFDLVNHDILLKKLSLYLQNNDSLIFFTSYLSSRLQFVSINCKNSSLGNVTCGVP